MGIYTDIPVGTNDGSITGRTGSNFVPLPHGSVYRALLGDFKYLVTSTGGRRAEVTAEIIEGEHAGRCIYDSINLLCASAKAKSIALEQFRALCIGVGNEALFEEVYNVNSEEELELLMVTKVPIALTNKIVEITVGIERGTNGYPDRNKIRAYRQIGPATAPSLPRLQPVAVDSTIVRPEWMP